MQTVDVSEAGLAYISRRADPVGSFLRVNLRVFDDPNSWVDVDGVVRRVDRGDGTYTHGVQFVGISEPAAIRLRHYVKVAAPKPDPAPATAAPPAARTVSRSSRSGTTRPTPVEPRSRPASEPSPVQSANELSDLFRKALEQVK